MKFPKQLNKLDFWKYRDRAICMRYFIINAEAYLVRLFIVWLKFFFFGHRHHLKELNTTHITLILKKDNLKKVSDYGLISLFLQIYFKTVGKSFSYGSSKGNISLERAFAPQRDIHDNILIAHEILSTLNRKRNNRLYGN